MKGANGDSHGYLSTVGMQWVKWKKIRNVLVYCFILTKSLAAIHRKAADIINWGNIYLEIKTEASFFY